MAGSRTTVRAAKLAVVVLLIVILVLGWLFTAGSVLGKKSDEELQNELIARAGRYLADEIYVLAAEDYVEALKYNTDRNPVLEEKLLKIYKDGGMNAEYYALIDERIAGNRASLEEYLFMSHTYIDARQDESALEYIKTGLESYPDSEELYDLSESLKYKISTVFFDTADVRYDISDSLMPAFDGEKWGFSSLDGKLIIPFRYDFASSFCNGYAVVKEGEHYILIDSRAYRYALDKNELEAVRGFAADMVVGQIGDRVALYSNSFLKLTKDYHNVILSENGMSFVKENGRWALLDRTLEPVTGFIFTDVLVNSRGFAFAGGYATVADESGYYRISEDGTPTSENRFKRAKGSEGGFLAVCDDSGKWGYANLAGDLVFDCEYEDAYSFSEGLGAVKTSYGWGYLSRKDEIVIGGDYKEARPFNNDRAVVRNSDDRLAMLSLDYGEYVE